MKRRHAALAVAVLALLLVLGAGLQQWQQRQQRERGAALFNGERPLVARLQGHAQPLPGPAVRCANCHQALDAAPRPYAGLLSGTALATPRSRRGGPPSTYDAARLCALLRSGVDPARVMIPNTMPRYEPTDDDCADLWAHLRDDVR